jgi:hypothetical protein
MDSRVWLPAGAGFAIESRLADACAYRARSVELCAAINEPDLIFMKFQ